MSYLNDFDWRPVPSNESDLFGPRRSSRAYATTEFWNLRSRKKKSDVYSCKGARAYGSRKKRSRKRHSKHSKPSKSKPSAKSLRGKGSKHSKGGRGHSKVRIPITKGGMKTVDPKSGKTIEYHIRMAQRPRHHVLRVLVEHKHDGLHIFRRLIALRTLRKRSGTPEQLKTLTDDAKYVKRKYYNTKFWSKR